MKNVVTSLSILLWLVLYPVIGQGAVLVNGVDQSGGDPHFVALPSCIGITDGVCYNLTDNVLYQWNGLAVVPFTGVGDNLGTSTYETVRDLWGSGTGFLMTDGTIKPESAISITTDQITDLPTYLDYADIVALWTTCTGYLKSDGTCDTPAGGVDTSGTPVQYDMARFTDADTIEGVSYAEFFALHDNIIWGAAAGGSQVHTFDTGAGTDPAFTVSDTDFTFNKPLVASGFTSNAADGEHYYEAINTAAITATATAGRVSYYNGYHYIADGTDWNDYLLNKERIDTQAEFGSVLFSVLVPGDVDDTPDDGATTTPPSENWAYDHAAKAAHLYHQTANVNPDALYTNEAGIFVLDPKTTAAITITEIYVAGDDDPTQELTITCYHKTAAIGYTGGTTIDANDTVAGTFTATSFDDATVPSGSKIWCAIGDDPDATHVSLELSITATYD